MRYTIQAASRTFFIVLKVVQRQQEVFSEDPLAEAPVGLGFVCDFGK